MARVAGQSSSGSQREVQLLDGESGPEPGYAAYLVADSDERRLPASLPVVRLNAKLGHIGAGDIIRVSPAIEEVAVLYRRGSDFNVIFTTERCNSDCVMCSQPPKDVDDRFLVDAFLQAIPLMAPGTKQLGISGGEPTLLGNDLFRLIESCRNFLPNTSLHMLSNGRLFNYLTLAQRLAGVRHPELMVGIPLYSDIASKHDHVVQAQGAFEQTLRGVMNLSRCGVSVELRIVLHRLTVDRLPQLCRFIARNLPIVDHVALMGLEPIGYVRMNQEALWADPVDYRSELRAGVKALVSGGLNVSIYNHQLCVLDRDLWPYARMSISDWKNDYDVACTGCVLRNDCGGFFGHSSACRSRGIKAILPACPQGENQEGTLC
ncbi:MAG: His-Xaa-Ser system radical SAM maturase HxsC [Tepidisphaeraceae bacterium]